jgi:hypothetical protein
MVDIREDNSGGGMVMVPMLGLPARGWLGRAVVVEVEVAVEAIVPTPSIELKVLTPPLPDPSDAVPGILPPYPLSTSSSACLATTLTDVTAPPVVGGSTTPVDGDATTGLLTGSNGVHFATPSTASPSL